MVVRPSFSSVITDARRSSGRDCTFLIFVAIRRVIETERMMIASSEHGRRHQTEAGNRRGSGGGGGGGEYQLGLLAMERDEAVDADDAGDE